MDLTCFITKDIWEQDQWQPIDMERDPDLLQNGILNRYDQIMMMLENTGPGCSNDAKLAPCMIFSFPRKADMTMDHILRISLKDPEYADIVLDILGMSSLSITLGGTPILEMKRLAFSYLITEELKRDKIKLLYTEEIDGMSKDFEKPFKRDANKWIYEGRLKNLKKGRYFLDIPLQMDFFMSGCPISGVWLAYHDIRVIIDTDPIACTSLQKYLHPEDALQLYSNQYTYCSHGERRELVSYTYSFVTLRCTSQCMNLDPYGKFTVNGSQTCKFFMIMMKYHDSTYNNIMPEIIHAVIHYPDGSSYTLDINFFFVRDYKREIRFYVISPDVDTNMADWCSVQYEFNKRKKCKVQSDDTYSKYTNEGNIIYRPITVDHLEITLNDWPQELHIESYCISQSVIEMRSGMGCMH
jgi:hypothetical protein